ncbi:MAG: flagellar hook-length control protein FliK [Actinomycetota bacterium]
MNPEALPATLSELLLPEARADHGATGDRPSEADVDRFERYLQSARQGLKLSGTGTGDQPLPAPARTVERPTNRLEPSDEPTTRAEPIDRSRDPERPTDDGPDATDTSDRGVDDRRVDRPADDDRVADEAEVSADDGEPVETTGTGSDEERQAGDEETAETDGAAEVDPDQATSTAPTVVATELEPELVLADGEVEPDAAGEIVDEVSAPVDGVVVEETPIETSGTADRGNDGPSVLGTQLDRSVEPAAATAARSQQVVGDDDGAGEAVAEDQVDLTGIDVTGEDSASPAELDLTVDGGGEATADTDGDAGADGDGRPSTPNQGDGRADQGQGTEVTTDGPDLAPVANQAAAAATRTTANGATTSTGGEAVVGVAGARARTTTNAAAPTQAADGPVFDGDPADPLWLQVRRAIGSLRTLQNGEQQLTIRLRPAELGSVVVRVAAGEGGTTVSLVADSAIAATQLTQQRQQLVSELEQSGLTGVAVDVGTGGNPDAADTDQANPDGDDPGAGAGTADGTAAAAAAAGSSNLPRTGGRGRRPSGSSGGLVDVEL